MGKTLDEIKASALSALRENIKCQGEWPTHNQSCDMVHEVADGAVPIYTSDLCALASEPDIFHHECELGKPKDIEQHVQYACYEVVSQYLFGELDDLKESMQEDGDLPSDEDDGDEEDD